MQLLRFSRTAIIPVLRGDSVAGTALPTLSQTKYACCPGNYAPWNDLMSAPSTATPEVQTSQPLLLYVQGGEQRTIALEHLPFTIGRKTDRDLVIADSRVSREHAMIIADNGEYYVVDQSSRHGTFVNGIKRDRQRLQPNDRIDFGARDASYCIFNPERARTSSAAGRRWPSRGPRC